MCPCVSYVTCVKCGVPTIKTLASRTENYDTWWTMPNLWSHWYSLFQTLIDSAHGLQSQDDASSPALCSDLHVMNPQQAKFLVPILHLGMVRLPLDWLPSVTSGTAGRGGFEPTTSWLSARTDWAWIVNLHWLPYSNRRHRSWSDSVSSGWRRRCYHSSVPRRWNRSNIGRRSSTPPGKRK